MYLQLPQFHLKNWRNKLWKIWLSLLVDSYSKVRNDLRALTRTLRSDFERNPSENNPKAFWSYVNFRLKFHPTIQQRSSSSVLMAPLCLQIEIKQRHLAFFTSMFTHENLYLIPSFTPWKLLYLPCIYCNYITWQLAIAIQYIYKKLLDINPVKSPGPEGCRHCLL